MIKIGPLTINWGDPAERPMLSEGSVGEDVASLQRTLGGVKDDGDFGPLTREAVKAFQRKKGLVADGIVGPKTWKALG